MNRKLDLDSPGVSELIMVANKQFQTWAKLSREKSLIEIPPGNNMELWTIMSRLALHKEQEYMVVKKEMYKSIPNLKEESVRKYVAFATRCGFVVSVKGTGPLMLQLTKTGREVVLGVIEHWAYEFSKVHRKYFEEHDSNA